MGWWWEIGPYGGYHGYIFLTLQECFVWQKALLNFLPFLWFINLSELSSFRQILWNGFISHSMSMSVAKPLHFMAFPEAASSTKVEIQNLQIKVALTIQMLFSWSHVFNNQLDLIFWRYWKNSSYMMRKNWKKKWEPPKRFTQGLNVYVINHLNVIKDLAIFHWSGSNKKPLFK